MVSPQTPRVSASAIVASQLVASDLLEAWWLIERLCLGIDEFGDALIGAAVTPVAADRIGVSSGGTEAQSRNREWNLFEAEEI